MLPFMLLCTGLICIPETIMCDVKQHYIGKFCLLCNDILSNDAMQVQAA
jgi:hypothetical protein